MTEQYAPPLEPISLGKRQEGLLLVLCGPSGAGKGTVVAELLARENESRHKLCFSVSMTTRQKRVGEEDGKNYFFVSREEFEKNIGENTFLEYAEYAGNLYGTPRYAVEEAVAEGKAVLLEIEVQGALSVKRAYPQAVMVFLMPPSFEVLSERLYSRGTEAAEIVERRLAIARDEFNNIREFDYLVWNDTILHAVMEIDSILRAERCKVIRRV